MGLAEESQGLGPTAPMSMQLRARTSYDHMSEHLGPPSQIKLLKPSQYQESKSHPVEPSQLTES